MTHTAPPPGGGFREAARWGGVITLLAFGLLLCFCSLLPALLLASFVFNALMLGSSLFSTLAQEREKRTIDALRLTQLSSLDILRLKSHGELRRWARGNVALSALMLGAAWYGDEPLTWAVSGALALAASGLLSIGMALAVSTRSETTSSAVVSGWVSKGAWLAGLPLLDQVVEAVFVTDGSVYLFRYLDPAWVALRVGEACFFDVPGVTPAGLWLGAGATVVVALLAVLQSSRLIDSSFESAASLDDRTRHSAYGKTFPLGLHENPFFVREMAWQMRSGAGRWPGYAVFLTLFLAPFLYGVAQGQKGQGADPIKVVRQDVVVIEPRHGKLIDSPERATDAEKIYDSATVEPERHARAHSHLCFSRLMGLPVGDHTHAISSGYRSVVTPSGRIEQVSEETLRQLEGPSDEAGATYGGRSASARAHEFSRYTDSYLEYELGRGLLTGLLLTVVYLFVRGGAFMAGSITGEKERRAWDQIALTGVSPHTFVNGKLAAVLAFPLKQMLFAAPALGLFAAYGVISWLQLGLVVALLTASFAAAGALGMACSTTRPTSHEAQGASLGIAAALLLLPMFGAGWLVLGAGLLATIFGSKMSAPARLFGAGSVLLAWIVGGASVSPVAAVMSLCGSDVAAGSLISAMAGPSGALLASTLAMTGVAALFHQVAVGSLESGGSVEA